MSRSKRPWGVVAGPIIFFVGLAVFLGAQKAQGVKELVADWGHELDHSAEPVVMELPVYVPLFIGGDWVGRLESIVVERERAGAVDGLRLAGRVSKEQDLAVLQGCNMRLRPPSDDIAEFKRALRCVRETDGMLGFGHVTFNDGELQVPLFVRAEDLPCEKDFVSGPCGRLEHDVQAELRDLAEELRLSADEFRVEAERIKVEVRTQLREKLRGTR